MYVNPGDCLVGLPTLESVDHIITDPPFEVEAHTLQRRAKRTEGIKSEPLAFAPITEELRDAAAKEFARICKRWCLVFCQIEAAHLWQASLERYGMTYKRTCIWVKPDGQPQYSGDRPGMGYETIVLCHGPGRSSWNGGGHHGVFVYNKNDRERTGHQTQKPQELMRTLVRLFSDPGDLICDPFAGSGSTGVAAVHEGRRFVGWELDPEWAVKAEQRIGMVRRQTCLI
jgi:DNA modification methylase